MIPSCLYYNTFPLALLFSYLYLRCLYIIITNTCDVFFFRKLGLDLVPRCGAEMVDPATMSAVELYKIVRNNTCCWIKSIKYKYYNYKFFGRLPISACSKFWKHARCIGKYFVIRDQFSSIKIFSTSGIFLRHVVLLEDLGIRLKFKHAICFCVCETLVTTLEKRPRCIFHSTMQKILNLLGIKTSNYLTVAIQSYKSHTLFVFRICISSERFLVKISKEGFSNYIEKLHNNCTIFTVSFKKN